MLAKECCPLDIGFVNDLPNRVVNQEGSVVRIFLLLAKITAEEDCFTLATKR